KADGHPLRALVTYRNASNGSINYILSNALGFFSFPALLPGIYTVRADTPTQPFVSQEKDGIEITVGGQMVVDFSLEPKGGTAAVSAGLNISPSPSKSPSPSPLPAAMASPTSALKG